VVGELQPVDYTDTNLAITPTRRAGSAIQPLL
jgi:hypothetical protein